jgi:hypothetical protein
MSLNQTVIILTTMPVSRLSVKERKEKNKEKLKDVYNSYILSKKRLNILGRKKTATICFNGLYNELVEFLEIKKHEMKEIEKELKKERGNMCVLYFNYKELKHKVDSQTRLDNERKEINDMKKEESCIAKTNKQLAASFDMNMLDRLPLELVDIIATYLPYEVRNTLVEERKPFRLFKILTTCTLKSFLMNICYTAEYFTLLTEDEKLKNIYIDDEAISWNPDWFQYKTKIEIETKIKHIFHKFKKSCPKGAYKLMRMFLVLINPDKKYNKYDGSWTRLTSIPV